LTINLATLHIPRKKKACPIISLFCVPLELKPKMKNLIELEIEDTTYKARPTSYLDLNLEKEIIIYVRA